MGIITMNGDKARRALLRGITELNDAVKVTLGPAGRIVVFRVPNGIIHTKDGVTVAREMNLSDPFESIGADVAKSVAGQAVDQAGDGTTTATLLIQAIFEGGVKAIVDGYEPTRLAAGIRYATKAIVGVFDEKEKKFKGGILERFKVDTTEELAFHVAKISANGDEDIARVVSQAVLRVGVEGAISIGMAQSDKHQLETVEGLQFDSGFASGWFVTDPQRNRAAYDDCLVFISDRRLSTQDECKVIVERAIKIAAKNEKPFALLVIANDIDQEALQFLVGNRINNRIPIVAVTSPAWGPARRDLLEDIAIISDGERIDGPRGTNFSDLTNEAFGSVARVTVTQNRTIITGYPMNKNRREKVFEPYVARVRATTENVELHPADVDRAKQRLASLTGGVAVVKVGGNSGGEVKERGFRVEDAIHATRAAVADGVVPGGGSALLFARDVYSHEHPDVNVTAEPGKRVSDHTMGEIIVLEALERPIAQIARNAGADPEHVAMHVLGEADGGRCNGYDAKDGLFLEDMIEAGIVDPLKVVRSALNASATAAAQLLVTEVVITNSPDTPMNR
jgi:chaperonin GroEL